MLADLEPLGGTSAETDAQSKQHDVMRNHVSIFTNCKTRQPFADAALHKVLEIIKSCRIQDEIEEVRRAYQAGGKDAAKPLKERLPAFTPSGTFVTRQKNALIAHSGVLVCDVDGLEDVEDARQRVEADPHTLFVFTSPTGAGLKIGVRIPADAALHTLSYLTVEKYFKEHLGMTIDPSRKDVCGLCFLSSDPNLFSSPDALAFDPDFSLADESKTTGGHKPSPINSVSAKTKNAPVLGPGVKGCSDESRKKSKGQTDRSIEHRVRRALRFIDPAEVDYQEWCIKVGAALHHDSDGADWAFEMWDEWSQRDPGRYDAGVLETSWRSFGNNTQNNPVTIASLFALAKEHGWKADEKPSEWFDWEYPNLQEQFGRAVEENWTNHEYTDAAGEKRTSNRLHVKRLNEDFLAAMLGKTGTPDAPTVFLPTEGSFYWYDPTLGYFARTTDSAVASRVSEVLLACARDCGRPSMDVTALEFKLRATRSVQGVVERAKGLLSVADGFFRRPAGLIPCANGILTLAERKLIPFSPEYHFTGKMAFPFDPNGKCPEWLKVLKRALHDDDIDLLQRYCGQVLTGENASQKMLVMSGAPQTGKGTIVRVLIGLCGAENVSTLRTDQLGGRFELARLRRKTLIYGADVGANFLNTRGAHILKAITGGDPIAVEYKGSNTTPPAETIPGNVLVTANSRLRIRLEGDSAAWQRRLVILQFDGQSVPDDQVAPGLSDWLLTNEGPGIIKWSLEGHAKLTADEGKLQLNARQKAVRDALLTESESHRQWAVERLIPCSNGRVTIADGYLDYVNFCTTHEWVPLTRTQFGRVVKDTVLQVHKKATRNDIIDGIGTKEGWSGLALAEE